MGNVVTLRSIADRRFLEAIDIPSATMERLMEPVLLRMLLALLASFTPSCCALAPAMPAQTRAPAHRPPPAVTRMGLWAVGLYSSQPPAL